MGRTLEISFTLPSLATDGARLTKPLEVTLLRNLAPTGQSAQTDASKLQPWISLRPAELARYTKGTKVTYVERLVEQDFNQSLGTTSTFALRTLTRGFRSRPAESEGSNTVSVPLLDVSEPVRGLEVNTTEKALELRWSPPSRSLGGRPLQNLTGYRVYRSTTRNPGSFQRLGEADSPNFSERNFEFGRNYLFKVRAVFKAAGRTAESEDSEIVEITPRDTFPPAAPTSLSAVYTTQAVELLWTANSEPELAGYNIYRREGAEQPRRINQGLVRTPIFRDMALEGGHNYFYKVTAVDLAGNESPASAEIEVEAK